MKNTLQYSFDDYDQFNCLRPSSNMWVIMIYLTHGFALMLMYFASKFKARGGGLDLTFMEHMHPMSVLAAIPAVLVIWSYFNRKPEKGGFVKWMWMHGRSMLVFSCVLNMLLPILQLFHSRIFHITTYGVFLFS